MLRILCEKSTSVLFPRVDKVIQAYCCSVCSKKSNAHNKNKRTQNSITYNDSIVSTPRAKAVSESINTDRKKCVDSCGDTFSNDYTFNAGTDKNNLSDVEKEYWCKMYGAKDSYTLDTEMNKDDVFYKKGIKIDCNKNHTANRKKKYRHIRTHNCCVGKNTGVQAIMDEKCPAKMVNKAEQYRFNKKSLASIYTIYRKNRKNVSKLRNETSYDGGNCMGINENHYKMFNDAVEEQNNICKNNVIGKSYCCKLKHQTQNVREKMSNLYRVCSQKFIGQCRKIPLSSINPVKTCPRSSYRDGDTDKYTNQYRENVKTCSDTCSTMKLYNKLQRKLKRQRHHYAKNKELQNVEVQNEKDQTGEPLFEMKVNNIDMCVLNSSEIKNKVLSLGKEKKEEKCICPSHAAREKYILKKEACVKGICKKMLKDKQTDFTCKCLKNKLWTCTDTTCGKAGAGGTTVSTLNMKPLFEVQVDKENMCIINPDEIRSKMKDIDKRSRKLCNQGICKNKSKERHTRINCKCNKRREAGECSEKTCNRKRIRRNNHLRGNISGPCGIHQHTSFRNLRNKLTSMCSLVVNKSENYYNCIKRRKRRPHRRQCNPMLCSTQSDNINNKCVRCPIHRRTGLSINLKRKLSICECTDRNRIDRNEILHAAHADCCPCNVYNSERHRVPQTKRPKLKKNRVKLASCILKRRRKNKKDQSKYDCVYCNQWKGKTQLNSIDSPCVCETSHHPTGYDNEKQKRRNLICPCTVPRDNIPKQRISSIDSPCGVCETSHYPTGYDDEKLKRGKVSCSCKVPRDYIPKQRMRNRERELQPQFVSVDSTMQNNQKPKQGKGITTIYKDDKPKQKKGKTICICEVDEDDKNSKPMIGKILTRLAQVVSKKSVCACEETSDGSKSKLWKNKIQYFIPAKSPTRNRTTRLQMETVQKKRDNSLCKCHHICECKDAKLHAKAKANQNRQTKTKKQDNKKKTLTEREKRKRQEKLKRLGMKKKNKQQDKIKSLQQRQKKNKMKLKSKAEHKRWLSESKMKRKQVLKEKKKAMKEEKKQRKIQMKREKEIIAALESEGGKQPSCFVVILESIFSLFFKGIGGIFYLLFKLIISPVKSVRYLQDRFHDREGTFIILKRKIMDAWRIRKLKIRKCMGNSETMSILSDTLKDTALFQSVMDKGKTKKDQARIELETKSRKKRIKKRQEQAIYGCRHSLLTTLRKTPCLWCYHVWPNMYPQCLSLLTFMRNFGHICLFTMAFICWTPCILLFEIVRALCCCFLCTG